MELVNDTSILRQMTIQEVDVDLLEELAKKKYTILIYEPRNFDGSWSLQFWNNQYIVADEAMVYPSDTTLYIVRLNTSSTLNEILPSAIRLLIRLEK